MNTYYKLISIIIPCYNVELYLERCIESLIQQSIGIENLELIFVNDASTDNTLSILHKYESQHPNSIKVIDLPYNIKQGGARNVGIQYATSNYVAYVDADDWVELDMYERLYTVSKEYNCDLVTCNLIRDYGNSELKETGNSTGVLHTINTIEDRKRLILKGIKGGICSILIKKEIIIDNNIYFLENIYYEDNFFMALILLYINNFYTLDRTLYHYFVNYNSTSLKPNNMAQFDRLKVELNLLEELRKRDYFKVFASEIEYRFLTKFYANTLHIMFLRFDQPLYHMYVTMKELVIKNFPRYYSNPYIEESDTWWIGTIYTTLTEADFFLLCEQYKVW